MKLPAFLSPVAAAFRTAAVTLTKVEPGKAGMTGTDFDQVVGWVINIDQSDLDAAEKSAWVVGKVLNWFGLSLPSWPWIPWALVWAAHQVAKRRNLLAKKPTPTPS